MAERTPAVCVVEGCDRPQRYSSGICAAHYKREWRASRHVPACSVEGCDKPTFCRGWCTAHYSRWQRHGDLALTKRDVNRKRRLNAGGYVEIKEPDHPQATSKGWVLEHRKVLHDAGVDLTGRDVHHINHDRADNRLGNLLPVDRAAHSSLHWKGVPRAGTHCPHGHEYTTENTYLSEGKFKVCRTCLRQRSRANRERERRR